MAERRALSALAPRLHRHVNTLARTIGERHTRKPAALEAAALYIEQQLAAFGFAPAAQAYCTGGVDVRNIEVEVRGSAEIVIAGAHYDSVPGCPAANDNGSGVASVLELARLLEDSHPAATLRFVFFPNEEPPYFLTPFMGSYVYAQRCRERREKVVAMFSMETIGYYSDRPGSQQYPFPNDGSYPDVGNFIGFVANPESKALLDRSMRVFRATGGLDCQGIAAPADMPFIGWSDHASFWTFGYPALMVTDTAPMRYPAYHTAEDTPEKLDYERMAQVVLGVERIIRDLAGCSGHP